MKVLSSNRDLPKFKKQGFSENIAPWLVAKAELEELASKLSSIPRSTEDTVELIISKIGSLEKSANPKLLHTTFLPLAKDLADLATEAIKARKSITNDSVLIVDTDGRVITKYIGPVAHRVLAKSRLLGLVPFRLIDSLRTAKIRSMGASVAASTLDTLVSMGAEDVKFWDSGKLEPSNGPRMPGGSIYDLGKYKAEVLERQLKSRNPHAKIRGYVGSVISGDPEKISKDDINYLDFVADADIVIEVVDSSIAKAGIRVSMRDSKKMKPLVMIADVGSNPFVGVEYPTKGNHFNQEIDDELLNEMAGSINQNIGHIYKMVRNDLPLEHMAQLMLVRLGLVPFFSQTAISARESGALATKVILKELNNRSKSAYLLHANETPTSLFNNYTDEQQNTLREICDRIFV